MIPYPCARALFMWGKPIWVDKHASRKSLEAKRVELERTLLQLTNEADEAVMLRKGKT
ncbi:MAG: hypothetical protein MRJ96_13165 [Nitrospirales bacterium]|nr:hypothetical protein [Nitrospira sp.]MDR4502394.1 hypothetical protein [Nitrospirales bacterium]